MNDNPLGKSLAYPTSYNPGLLYAIPRLESRQRLGIDSLSRPMSGLDIWRAWELSWLDATGCPAVAIGQFIFDADSPNLIESKSLKLYLNSLNNESFASEAAVRQRISEDLSRASGNAVRVRLLGLDQLQGEIVPALPGGRCLDDLSFDAAVGDADAGILSFASHSVDQVVQENIYTNLFRSNCPVTGQPDWATVLITYRGRRIDAANLLAYLCSFRHHQGFHEQCAEQIFLDLCQVLKPEELVVGMHFTRRGGVEINPYRSTRTLDAEDLTLRMVRQ